MSDLPLALVTGASRGIGAAVAHQLAPTHRVLLGGRDASALDALALDLPGATPWPVELTDPPALAAACASIDSLDVLVHSAGVASLGPIASTPASAWQPVRAAPKAAASNRLKSSLTFMVDSCRRGRRLRIEYDFGTERLPRWQQTGCHACAGGRVPFEPTARRGR